MTSEKEMKEQPAEAKSGSLKKDMERLAGNSRNYFVKNGKVDIDGYIDFLNAYNEFINHSHKTFKPIKDRNMRL
jgi:hypothetical protein